MPEFSLWESLAQHRGHFRDKLDKALADGFVGPGELFGLASQLGECSHQIFSDLEILTPTERADQVADVAGRLFDENIKPLDFPWVAGEVEAQVKASLRQVFCDSARMAWALADRKEAVIRRV